MFTAFINLLAFVLFAEGSGEAHWWNQPGFEAWKFFNLAIFIGLLYYILKRPVAEALRNRAEGIRRELKRAQQERDAANLKLAEVEQRLAKLDNEVAEIRRHAEIEAEEERENIRRTAELESKKLREQAQREIQSAAKAAKQHLREFAAEQTVQLAEGIIRNEIRPEDDTRLIDNEVAELGGIKR